MNRFPIATICALAFAAALAGGVLFGCANTAVNTATAEQQANRAYMSQVNEIMVELGDGLGSFIDAVSRNDIVNMRTQAENAFQVLDRLESIEAPDALADVHEKYVDGTGKMREALEAYIELYTDMNGASFDQSTYEERIEIIQELYDEGIAALQEGDETAAGKS